VQTYFGHLDRHGFNQVCRTVCRNRCHSGFGWASASLPDDGSVPLQLRATTPKQLVILESNAYLVCTENRGVMRGEPILVGHEEAVTVVDFDPTSG
jgi:hypothetical protein